MPQKEKWPASGKRPKFAKILAEQVKMKEWTEASLTELLNDSYMNRLY